MGVVQVSLDRGLVKVGNHDGFRVVKWRGERIYEEERNRALTVLAASDRKS